MVRTKKMENAWAIFDWANSVYALVISAAVFPAYFLSVTDPVLNFYGWKISNSSFYSLIISGAFLVMAFLSPLLSGIADYGNKKKLFLKFFTTLGSLACICLYFFKGMSTIEIGAWGFIFATIGFAGGLVFYNAYLPVVAKPSDFDRVSAKGFAFGYFGSVLLLIVNLVTILHPDWFGFESSALATRVSFLLVGIWWISFAQISFRAMPSDSNKPLENGIITKGYKEIKKVMNELKSLPEVKRFLIGFFFYNSGVQTVLYLAASFAKVELKFMTTELIIIILLLQLVGLVGALMFSRLSKLKGNKVTLVIILVIWVFICIFAYFVYTKSLFYVVAALVGMVMGGVQSLSRATYSKLIYQHKDELASYYSFYDVLEKFAIVIGTFGFGFVEWLTGSMRTSVLVLILYFLVGLYFIIPLKVPRIIEDRE